MTTTDLPTPSFASQGLFNGGFETRIDVVAERVSGQLNQYGPLHIAESGDILLLEEGTEWPEIEAFYDSAFARPPLDAFVREPVASAQPDRYRLAMWRDGDAVLGVALILGQPGDPLPFLLRIGSVAPK